MIQEIIETINRLEKINIRLKEKFAPANLG